MQYEGTAGQLCAEMRPTDLCEYGTSRATFGDIGRCSCPGEVVNASDTVSGSFWADLRIALHLHSCVAREGAQLNTMVHF